MQRSAAKYSSREATLLQAGLKTISFCQSSTGGMFPRVFADEFGDEFGDYLNLVINLVTNSVMNFVNH